MERDDFASGTSSKSSKLVHGGLRYLQQKEFRLVYENLYERQIILRNAPHLVRVLPFLIPVLSRDGLIHPKIARALGWALWLYDLTGGARVGKLHKRIDKEQALAHMPTIRPTSSRARTSTTTPRPTTPDSRSRSSAPPPNTVPWWPTGPA